MKLWQQNSEARGRKEGRIEQGYHLAQYASTQANKPQAQPAHRVVDSSLLFQKELVLAIVIVQALHRPDQSTRNLITDPGTRVQVEPGDREEGWKG